MKIFLFLFSLFLYIITLSPDISWEDSGKNIISCFFISKKYFVSPFLYSFWGKIFTFIPIGNIPFRINFSSAFSSSITGVIYYNLVLFFLKDTGGYLTQDKNYFRREKITAFLSWVVFITSFTQWHFAVNAERNSFIFLFYITLLYLVMKFASEDIRVLYFIS